MGITAVNRRGRSPYPLHVKAVHRTPKTSAAIPAMALLHALVANDSTVLAESHGPNPDLDVEAGNTFSNATSTILSKIPPNDSKLSYQADDYLFHYIRQGPVTVLCMADEDLPRRVAFAFLNELLKRYTSTYTLDDITSASPYSHSSFAPSIAKLMEQYTSNPPADPVKQAQQEIDGVKQIMVHNIDEIIRRGERLDLIIDKTDNMSTQARAFKKRSQVVRRKMYWKNMKLIALTAVILVVILLVLNGRRGA